MILPPLRLKKNEDRRLRAGHLWIFSNEVDVARTPLSAFEPGQIVRVEDSGGRPIGSAYVNPHSLICARLFGRDSAKILDQALLVRRIQRALRLRTMLFPEPFGRLVYGEGDWLPGLVVDRYGDVLVAQITTAGMERLRDEIVAALDEVVRPSGILLRNDVSSREMEGLRLYVESALGEVPDRVPIEENGVRFEVPLLEGQKTGWFYDHRANRERTGRYVVGKRVLDVFSYLGGWGVQAAVAGAAEVLAIDSSELALAGVQTNAELNGVGARIATLRSDASDALEALKTDGRRFDVVILDPPALIKRKKDLKQGERAYRRLNQLAMEVLEPEGILVSASCSFHFGRDALRGAMLAASRRAGRELQILEQGGQAADHPVHPAIPETEYLKCFWGAGGIDNKGSHAAIPGASAAPSPFLQLPQFPREPEESLSFPLRSCQHPMVVLRRVERTTQRRHGGNRAEVIPVPDQQRGGHHISELVVQESSDQRPACRKGTR